MKNSKQFKKNFEGQKEPLKVNSRNEIPKKNPTTPKDTIKNKKDMIPTSFIKLKTETIINEKNKMNQKENVKVAKVIMNREKSFKSFHKPNSNQQKFSLQNEDKPPFKFGISKSNSKTPNHSRKEELKIYHI